MVPEIIEEKDIAPHVSEEVNGKNLVYYKFGETFIFELDSISKENHVSGPIITKELSFPYSSIISTSFVASVSYKSSGSTNSDFAIIARSGGKEVVRTDMLTASPELNLVKFNLPIPAQPVPLSLMVDNVSGNPIDFSITFSVELNYNKSFISTSDFNAPVFYVERLIANQGDALMLENFGQYFEGVGEIVFSKPIAIRKLHFIKGNPAVVLYFLKTN
ncbi:MAG TPA: hypothetical protein ENH95_06825 [Nitrosopumilus sp.]|nr:hypothetical protein [Nitrosopumilus sp.]